MKLVDMTGQVFGRLTVLHRSAQRNRYGAGWTCRCECGNEVDVLRVNLRNGNQRSCGCLRQEIITKHGHTRGGKKDRVYLVWVQMRQRCQNPNAEKYPIYGARGIKVCDRWESFPLFLEDVGPAPSDKHSLDRIDNNGNYEPGNVRWATGFEQQAHTRASKLIKFRGERLPLSEWARRVGIQRETLKNRLKRGWPVERAFTERPFPDQKQANEDA